jgi:hypothetical protein
MVLTDGAVLKEEQMARIYRYELLNHLGYVVATLVISMSLFSFDFFREFIGPGRLLGPVVMGAMACLLAYFMSRFLVLSRIFNAAFVSIRAQEVSS